MAKKMNQNVQGTINQATVDPVNKPEKGSFIAGKMEAAKGAVGHAGGVLAGGVGALARNLSPAAYGAMTGLIGGTAIGIGGDFIGRCGVVAAENALNSVEFKKGLLGKKQSMNLGKFRAEYGCIVPADELTGRFDKLRKLNVTGPMTPKVSATCNKVVDVTATAGGALSGAAIAKKNYRSCKPQQPTCTSQDFFDAFNSMAENAGFYEEPAAEEYVEGGEQQ